MTPVSSAVDLAPIAVIAAIGIALAALPLVFWHTRGNRLDDPPRRLRSLALLTLFLSADLVLIGAFTRLSDSGLGCPDWPGCYGHASPIGAAAEIAAAEAAIPTGAVTRSKAWIEMAHRYVAVAIGFMTIALAVLAWRAVRRGSVRGSPMWAYATVAWVVVQGAFGALTVTMRLYPAIVTLHLLGGMALLALLAAQAEAYAPRPLPAPLALQAGIVVVAVLAVAQIALGGWVSSNYAVLACSDFPTCQGRWWPDADFASAFVVQRELGRTGDGAMLAFPALTAIHLAHRIGALVLAVAVAALAFALAASGSAALRRFALALVGIIAWQVASGLGNVLLGWPLAAAVAHTAGAAALVIALTMLAMRVCTTREGERAVPARQRPATIAGREAGANAAS